MIHNADVRFPMSPGKVNEDKKPDVSNSDLPIKPQERLFTTLKPRFLPRLIHFSATKPKMT